jgi:hypothetical protein
MLYELEHNDKDSSGISQHRGEKKEEMHKSLSHVDMLNKSFKRKINVNIYIVQFQQNDHVRA